jgi:type IV secretory pathway VirB10-like protein
LPTNFPTRWMAAHIEKPPIKSQRLIFLFLTMCTAMAAQDSALPAKPSTHPISTQTIALTVARNTPLQIALDREVRIRKAGQPIHGRLVQPLYAFDRLVVPAGTKVDGHITRIEDVSRKKRALGILNADFTPERKVEVQFDQLVLAEGRTIPFKAVVTPESGQVLQLVSAKDDDKKRKSAKHSASEKIDAAKQEAIRQWQEAIKQINDPGKMHRLERYAFSQLPARPQYLDAGTVYFAELQEPLDFGAEPFTPQMAASIGSAIPKGSLIHALLITPLDSATTKKGAAVEAVLSQPLFNGNRLILPEGSRLKGVVLQARPAARLHHNGQLRIAFRQIVPPNGVAQKVVASLESVQAGKDDHVKLDSEGGAEASTPKTRYLSTALSLALATAAMREHNDADDAGRSQPGVGGGAAGFKLVGIVLSFAIKSQSFGMAMGAYGASRSVYVNFIARGQDVVFPQNTLMEIGIGSRGKTILQP